MEKREQEFVLGRVEKGLSVAQYFILIKLKFIFREIECRIVNIEELSGAN